MSVSEITFEALAAERGGQRQAPSMAMTTLMFDGSHNEELVQVQQRYMAARSEEGGLTGTVAFFMSEPTGMRIRSLRALPIDGVAANLMEAVELEAIDAGATFMWSVVAEYAVELFETLGFVATTEPAFVAGEEDNKRVIMRKTLG